MRKSRFLPIPALDATTWAAVAGAAIVAIVFLVWLVQGPTVSVRNGREGERITSGSSSLTGTPCGDASRRPIAVMLASDREARPLSGLEAADLVFEMPVTPNGITRMMAVYQCHDPDEVGSIRSARMDFIPLVQGLGAVYAHWGGEHAALLALDRGVVDNVDALKYEGTVFFRKSGIPRPHNGFTTLDAVREKADELGYAASGSLASYPHSRDAPERNLASLTTQVAIDWPRGLEIEFRYDPETNRYLRWRGGAPETDRTTGRQVSVSVVVIMDTDAKPSYDQYLSVRTTGQGRALVYQNGRVAEGIWKKETPDAMLVFTDAQGDPIPFVPGPVWAVYDPDLL